MIPEQILNPSGCGIEINHNVHNVITICKILPPHSVFIESAGNVTKDGMKAIRKVCNAPTYEFELCPQCKNIQKAQAQVLLDEKNSELEFLEILDTEAMLNEQSKKIENKIQELQKEIKVLEGVKGDLAK
jgi:hypothetical protein